MRKQYSELSGVSPEIIAGAIQAGGQIIGNIGTPDEIKWSFPQCGKKPLFTFTQKHKDWQECVKRETDLNRSAMIKGASTRPGEQENFFKNNATWLVPIGIVVGVLIINQIKK